MITLFRFEDTYGLFYMFCKVNGFSLPNPSLQRHLVRLSDTCFAEYRLAKRFRDFLDIEMLNANILSNSKVTNDIVSFNELYWILFGCRTDFLLSADELMNLMDLVDSFYTGSLQNTNYKLIIDGIEEQIYYDSDLKHLESYLKKF